MAEPGTGLVRVLVERPSHPALAAAARALVAGESPVSTMRLYLREKRTDRLRIDEEFGAVPIGAGGGGELLSPAVLSPDESDKFLVRGFVPADDPEKVPDRIEDDLVYADASIGGQLVCGTSRAVGMTYEVQQKLDTAVLAGHGLDGAGVALAVVDSGIYLPWLKRQIGTYPAFDAANSWRPSTLTTKPGMHRIGHGTMCAFDALIAAPKATLIDVPILKARGTGDHSARGTVGAAMQGYWVLIARWALGQMSYTALVINNSWGILHPSLDLPPTHPGRYIDNPNHIFRLYVGALSLSGADLVFAAGNCGADCPSAVCLSRTAGTIMGANAYSEVLTLAGCDVTDARVGYSSQGPSIYKMPQQKPDLTAYTHFLGSRTYRHFVPDTGTSTASAVAAGCVAALRTRLPPGKTPPPTLFQVLRTTAHQVGAAPWNVDYGYGIIRPVAAGRALKII
jgi:hypothetical protein